MSGSSTTLVLNFQSSQTHPSKVSSQKENVFCIIILSMEEMRLVYGGTPRIKPSTKCFLEKYSQLVVERYKKTVYLGMRAGSLHLIMSHP